MNRALSTPHDDVLAAQGVSWLRRSAIAISTVCTYLLSKLTQVTLELKHTANATSKTETIHFEHTATGGIKGT
jgi:hypothetical protein